MLFTDLGGDSGISGAQVYANMVSKTPEKFNDNVRWVNLTELDSVEKFLENPEELIEDFWSFNPDFLVWDGFSFFQSTYILPEIEETTNTKDTEYSFETFQGWGKVKNATVRKLKAFIDIKNPNNTPLHKILTTASKFASEKVSQDRSEVRDQRMPDITGAALRQIKYAIDAVIETRREGDKFTYDMSGGAKNYSKRRFIFPETMDANLVKVLTEMKKQLKLS